MEIKIGPGAAPDFDQPVELMKACHRRIEKFLGVLERVALSASLDAETRPALSTALNYFHTAGPRHNSDEEDDLFPMLLALDGHSPQWKAKIDELAADHHVADAMHQRLAELGASWLATGLLSNDDLLEFRSLVSQLLTFYAHHIAVEETDIFPVASTRLTPSQLQQIGQNMRARRLENPGRSESQCAQRRQAGMK